MSLSLKIIALIFILAIIVILTVIVNKKNISIKYAIFWYLCLLLLTLFTIFPSLLTWVTKLFGMQVASNFIFAILIGTLFIVTIFLTMVVSEQNEKIRALIQEVSILKNDKKNK